MKRKLAGITAAAVAAVTLSSCGYQSATSGVQGVVQNGSFFGTADQNLIDCIKPQENKNELNDTVNWYPAHQISWDARGEANVSEHASYLVVSSNEAPANMLVPVVVTFNLTQDCNLLKKFHADIGTKYQGWINQDGTETDGWKRLVDYTVGQPLQATLLRVAQKYPWQKIWNDGAVVQEFQDALLAELPDATKKRTNGTEYFTGFSVQVFKPTPENQQLVQAIEQQQASVQEAAAAQAKGVADAKAAEAKAEADTTAAKAQTVLAEQQARQKEAEINAYGGIDGYLRHEAIEKGINPYQPTIAGVVPTHQ
jgi:hypothetical protein